MTLDSFKVTPTRRSSSMFYFLSWHFETCIRNVSCFPTKMFFLVVTRNPGKIVIAAIPCLYRYNVPYTQPGGNQYEWLFSRSRSSTWFRIVLDPCYLLLLLLQYISGSRISPKVEVSKSPKIRIRMILNHSDYKRNHGIWKTYRLVKICIFRFHPLL